MQNFGQETFWLCKCITRGMDIIAIVGSAVLRMQDKKFHMSRKFRVVMIFVMMYL
jgi:hypothetical protein